MDGLSTGTGLISLITFLILLVLPFVFGWMLAWRLKGPFYVGERILVGMTLGLTVATFLSFVGSVIFGFHGIVVLTAWLILAAVAVYLTKSRLPKWVTGSYPRKRKFTKTDIYGLAVFSGSLVIFTILMQRLIIWQSGGLSTGYLDAWGDLPLHISLIMSFTSDSKLLLENTILAGEPLTYPFLSDFFSATFVLFRIPLESAVEWPAILLNSITLTMLFYLSHRLVRNRRAALLVPVLFLLAGGLGFLWFLKDLYFAPKPIWEFLQQLPQRYTNMGDVKIHWVNPTLAHLIPQRSFLFGFPIGLCVILLWRNAFNKKRPQQAWVTGLLVGLLPLFHTHSFMTLLILAFCFTLLALVRKESRTYQLRYWLIFGILAFLLAAPQLGYLLSSKLSLKAIRFHAGWMSDSENLVWFWLKNLGLFIPLILIALAFHKRLGLRRRTISFYLPFGMLFVIGNLVLFAPFAYDNNKILIYWFLLSLPLVARLLVELHASKSWWLHAFAFRLLLISLIFSGSLNLIHEFQNGGWPELTTEEVQLAQEVRKKTNGRARFLTAPIHNNLLMLAGRSVVLGYPGHVYSHGLDYLQVEKAIGEIYVGADSANEHLRSFAVDYIVVGPHERQKFGNTLDWLENRYPVFIQSENCIVYEVTESTVSPYLKSAN